MTTILLVSPELEKFVTIRTLELELELEPELDPDPDLESGLNLGLDVNLDLELELGMENFGIFAINFKLNYAT